MKKIIRAVLCFGLFFIFGNERVWALVPMPEIRKDIDINIVSTSTPTPTSILIKPIKDINIDILPLATKTPTPIVVTQVVTATPQPTVSIKPTETVNVTVTTEKEITPEPTIEEIEKIEEKPDSNKWFWGVIIGLLILILIAQIWSTKKNEESQDKKNKIE